jgi:hypothetical protein
MEKSMAFKPNYQQERGNRNRAKEQKKQEKLRRLQEGSARRKGVGEDGEETMLPAEGEGVSEGEALASEPTASETKTE